ncbi:hypothetical protein [Helicobacter fennelliae]|nr:hypothetical protein [Helicobacter fennelliae]
MLLCLTKEGRILELARMISGATITQEAIDFAKKRLSENAQKLIIAQII